MPRILHLGVGNFHRAHQAWHTVRAGGDWRVTGVVMSNADLFDRLLSQDGAYHLGIRGFDGLTVERIAIHDRLLLASRSPQAVINAIVDPEVQVVTLTITEKGYCLGPDGQLDLQNTSIARDLVAGPGSALAMLAHGLSRRTAPVTVISCDNISGNGRKLHAAVWDYATAAGLSPTADIRFPDTMVDRITPVTTDAVRSEIKDRVGRLDVAPVMTEAFSEWIIEDDFAGPRPNWEKAGVEIVPDVAAFEMRKLRLLNAAHSYLAYSGLLAGHRYVHEAMADPALRAGVEQLWDEAERTLPETLSAGLAAYRAALVERFLVVAMRHELSQIAVDGSLKLRERLVPLVNGLHDAPQARRGIAAWVAFLLSRHTCGKAVADANATRIAGLLAGSRDLTALCAPLTGLIGLTDPSPEWLEHLAADVIKMRRYP